MNTLKFVNKDIILVFFWFNENAILKMKIKALKVRHLLIDVSDVF